MVFICAAMDKGFSHKTVPFMKMHGLGNDFVVIDERDTGPVVSEGLAIAMADRHRGVGFDQLVAIRDDDDADMELLFWNADGSMSGACGNATRCIAGWDMARRGVTSLTLRTERGLLAASDAGDGQVRVNMGAPQLGWQEVPLSHEMDTLMLPLEGNPTATGMGNPHCTFFVDDAEAIDLVSRGPEIENNPLFPERTNVQFAQIIGDNHIRMRVWERGAGITLASGSSSCATAVAAARRGLTGRSVVIELDGGPLQVHWTEEGVVMQGAWSHVFDGMWRGAS